MLTDNNASNNEFGIYMRYSSNNTLKNNILSGNTHNFGIGDGGLSDYTQNICTSNTVDGNPIYYWVDQKDVQIPNDAGFVGVVNSTNITVRDLTLTNNTQGVLFAYSANSRIDNVTTSNNWYSIDLRFSSNNILSRNTANSNHCGIYMGDSNNNTLENNNASNNDYYGIYLDDSSNNTLTCNTANSNDESIYLSWSCNNTLSRNTANSNDCRGIHLSSLSNNILSGNTANSNNWHGISLTDSSNNTLMKNNASNNGNGIFLCASRNNTICHNNLINNTNHNAYDYDTNAWDSDSEGNYYSNYNGTDNNTDGIGDTHHPIPGGGGSIDRFPLMHQWTGDTPQKGDLNGDHLLTPADAAIALRLAATSTHDDAADVSRDGRVTSLDALMILQAAAGGVTL